jgi:hypothetical protein
MRTTRAFGESSGYDSAIEALRAGTPKGAADLQQLATVLHSEADAQLKKALPFKRDAAKRHGWAHALRVCADSLETLAREVLAS